jgi:type I restriction enzyme M protein
MQVNFVLLILGNSMDNSVHNKLVSFIWSIADDELRDVYVRGKYRDVILPMFVLRRLDCLLEETDTTVQEEVRFQREEVGLTELDPEGLCQACGRGVVTNSVKMTNHLKYPVP